MEKERERKERKKKERGIQKFRTFNKGSSSIPISRRNEDDKKYRTDIYSSYRDIEDKLNSDINRSNENEINTSSKVTDVININNEINGNNDEIQMDPEQFYYYDESSDDLSNRAIDGGDSHRDEEEEEDNDNDDS